MSDAAKVFLVYVEFIGERNVQSNKPIRVFRTLQSAEGFRDSRMARLNKQQEMVDAAHRLTEAWTKANPEPSNKDEWKRWDEAENANRAFVWEVLNVRATDLPCPREYLDSAEYLITEIESDDPGETDDGKPMGTGVSVHWVLNMMSGMHFTHERLGDAYDYLRKLFKDQGYDI